MDNHEKMELDEVAQMLRRMFPKYASVSLFVTAGSYTFELNSRTPEALKVEGIAMRSLDGNWIRKDGN